MVGERSEEEQKGWGKEGDTGRDYKDERGRGDDKSGRDGRRVNNQMEGGKMKRKGVSSEWIGKRREGSVKEILRH